MASKCPCGLLGVAPSSSKGPRDMPSRCRMLVATLEPLRCMVRRTTSVRWVSSMIRSLSLDRAICQSGTFFQSTRSPKPVKTGSGADSGSSQADSTCKNAERSPHNAAPASSRRDVRLNKTMAPYHLNRILCSFAARVTRHWKSFTNLYLNGGRYPFPPPDLTAMVSALQRASGTADLVIWKRFSLFDVKVWPQSRGPR